MNKQFYACHDGKLSRRVLCQVISISQHKITVKFSFNAHDIVSTFKREWANCYCRGKKRGYGGWADSDCFNPWFLIIRKDVVDRLVSSRKKP